MGDNVKLPAVVHVNAIVAGSNPVTIAVDQSVFERQEPQCSVDIQD
jgi:hypothetical protein